MRGPRVTSIESLWGLFFQCACEIRDLRALSGRRRILGKVTAMSSPVTSNESFGLDDRNNWFERPSIRFRGTPRLSGCAAIVAVLRRTSHRNTPSVGGGRKLHTS